MVISLDTNLRWYDKKYFLESKCHASEGWHPGKFVSKLIPAYYDKRKLLLLNNYNKNKYNGFTLIETLVALAITATTLIALLSASHFATKTYTSIEQRFKAQVVAQYVIREIQLGLIKIPLKPYQYTQNILMFNAEWPLIAYAEKATIPTALQINVDVQHPNSKTPLIHLVGYMEKPL